MRSIKSRLIMSYLTLIFLTSAFIIVFLIFTIRQYYLTNMTDILLQHAETAQRFYRMYLSSGVIKQKSGELVNNFAALTDAEVQVIDSSGKLQKGTQPSTVQNFANFEDVKKALEGKTGKCLSVMTDTGEKVLAVSAPLVSGNGIDGIVRFVTAVQPLNKVILGFAGIMSLWGMAIMLVVASLGVILANGIVGPLKQLTKTAEEMAGGVLTVHAAKKYDDEVGRLADTINYMADELVKQEKMKQDFIASISHEIRTPLTAIKGWAVTLKQCYSTPEVEVMSEGLDIIEKESDRLTLLVEDLLDFSKLAANELTLNIEKLDVAELIRKVSLRMEMKARQAGVNIIVYSEEEGIFIKGDCNRLMQVFINILDNALKFSEEGSEINIYTKKRSGEAVIVVEDQGKGIAADELQYITKKFYKADGKAPGSGLGLAICSEIINLHNGKLKIDSKPGDGTTVAVSLPL